MKLTLLLSSATVALAAAALSFGLASAKSVEPTVGSTVDPISAASTIHIVEHPGYFETRGDIYNIDAGTYTFVVENRSGKDAGFVLARDGQDPLVIGIANGETGRLETTLESGASYSYFCPIIPTAPYPLSVK